MSLCGLIIGWRIRSSVVDAVAGYFLMVAFAFAMIWVGVLLCSLVGTPEGFVWKRLDEIEVGDMVATEYGADLWSALPARFDDFTP